MKRNKFDLSNYKLLSGNMGSIIPIGLKEVVPNDTWFANSNLLLRCSPLLGPVMHPVHVQVHHWFVPHRIVMDDFEDFITGGPDGLDATVFPTINCPAVTGFAEGSLADYLGVPTGVPDEPVSALPFRGYAKIWNEFYRDEQLQAELTIDTGSGADTTTSTALQSGCWEKDYFTSSRPDTQLGNAVTVSLGTSAPVISDGNPIKFSEAAGANASVVRRGNAAAGSQLEMTGAGSGVVSMYATDEGFMADLSSATGISVNALRLALAMQRYQEDMNNYGSRYAEYLRHVFKVNPQDSRLQRPEFLGGGKQTIQFSEVVQTGVDSSDLGLGNLGGHGIAALRSNKFLRHFTEHGYIFSFLIVRPKTIYQDGLSRHWSYQTKEDFYQPQLAHVGDQAILNKEVYLAHTTPDGVFGYQGKYDHLRRAESQVSGDFRSTLDFMHLARQFSGDPALNSSFVSSADVSDRIFAVPSEDTLWVMVQNNFKARRMIPKVATSFIK